MPPSARGIQHSVKRLQTFLANSAMRRTQYVTRCAILPPNSASTTSIAVSNRVNGLAYGDGSA